MKPRSAWGVRRHGWRPGAQPLPLEPSAQPPMSHGAAKRARCAPTWTALPHATAATGAFGGAPYRAAKRVRGAPTWTAFPHAAVATGAFGGAPLFMGPRNA
eukprot:5014024-Pyramimonas_sp.AAC.1